MRSLIQYLRGERRSLSREPMLRAVHIFLAGRHVGEAALLDESEDGARISLIAGAPPPPGAVLVDVETAHAHPIEVAWRGKDAVGVRYLGSQRLRGYVPPEYLPLKAFWEEAAVLLAAG